MGISHRRPWEITILIAPPARLPPNVCAVTAGAAGVAFRASRSSCTDQVLWGLGLHVGWFPRRISGKIKQKAMAPDAPSLSERICDCSLQSSDAQPRKGRRYVFFRLFKLIWPMIVASWASDRLQLSTTSNSLQWLAMDFFFYALFATLFILPNPRIHGVAIGMVYRFPKNR